MIKEIIYNAGWILPSWNHYRKLIKYTKNVEARQSKLLLEIIKKNKDTIYGKEHNFDNIQSIDDFQKLPLTEYKDYIKYIDLIEKKQDNILTKDKIILLMPTSGSTKKKLIPYTNSLKNEFQ